MDQLPPASAPEPRGSSARVPRALPDFAHLGTVLWLGAGATLALVLAVLALVFDRPVVGTALLVLAVLIGIFLWGAVKSRRNHPTL